MLCHSKNTSNIMVALGGQYQTPLSEPRTGLHAGLNPVMSCFQGCAVSRYRFGRTWIETIFWIGIGFGEPVFGYRSCVRYFFLTVGDTLVALQNLEPVSGPGSAIQNSCIEPNLGRKKRGREDPCSPPPKLPLGIWLFLLGTCCGSRRPS